MADSSPTHRRRPSSSPSDTQLTAAQPAPPSRSPSRASVPPSEPRSASRASLSQVDISADRPARLQMIVALILGLVLVAIPLYLWRRPRAESIPVASTTDAPAPPSLTAAPPAPSTPAVEAPVLGEARTILCQDPGPKKTPADRCGHLVEVEKALAQAIEETASCARADAAGGTVRYVADVRFKRKTLTVATPKEGRSMKSTKVVAACRAAVKGKLRALPLSTMPHAHARYKVAITATYPAPAKP